MEHWSRRTGRFFFVVCVLSWILSIATALINRHVPLGNALVGLTPMALAAIAALFFISSLNQRHAWIQPLIMTVVTALPFLDESQGSSTMYGLGFFSITMVLLQKVGFFDKNRVPKVVACLAYLYVLEIVASLLKSGNPWSALLPVFYITVFLVFLYNVYNERVVVYMRETKPRLSMTEKGLSQAERTYIRALAAGQNPKEIAVAAQISESTVRNTLSRAYRKLGVDDKTELTKLLERHELVE